MTPDKSRLVAGDSFSLHPHLLTYTNTISHCRWSPGSFDELLQCYPFACRFQKRLGIARANTIPLEIDENRMHVSSNDVKRHHAPSGFTTLSRWWSFPKSVKTHGILRRRLGPRSAEEVRMCIPTLTLPDADRILGAVRWMRCVPRRDEMLARFIPGVRDARGARENNARAPPGRAPPGRSLPGRFARPAPLGNRREQGFCRERRPHGALRQSLSRRRRTGRTFERSPH